jgi:hypothetical protein
MGMPISTAVASLPFAHDVKLDTLTTVLLLVLSAGIAWFLWRRKYLV